MERLKLPLRCRIALSLRRIPGFMPLRAPVLSLRTSPGWRTNSDVLTALESGLLCEGSETSIGESPSGKASVFGADIRWFESTLPSHPPLTPNRPHLPQLRHLLRRQ